MTEPALIADAHNHLDALSAEELDKALSDAQQAGVGLMVTVGMDPETSGDGVAIAARHEPVFSAVGLHPWMAQDYPDGAPIEELRALALRPEVVAIGEIGLDFVDNIWRQISYRDPELRRHQELVFRQQLRLARELDLGVILHGRDAHESITRTLAEEEMQGVGGCIQFQDGGPDDVSRYVELGFSFSIGSSVTYPDPGGWHDAIRAIPDEALLLESDAPWLPYSGKESERGAPADVALIGEHVAEIRGVDREELFALTAANLPLALPRIGSPGIEAMAQAITQPKDFDWVARGDLVLTDRVLEDGAIGIKEGRIAALFEPAEAPAPSPGRDYSGRLIMPGLVDTHVHAGSFRDEDIASTTATAAAGGVTTIIDMPYDREAPVMGGQRLSEKIATVGEEAIVDVGLYGTMAKVGGVEALEELVEGGVCAFKFSLFEYDADRFPRIADGDLYAAFELLSASGVPIVLHSELQELIEYRLERMLDTPAESHPHAQGRSRPPVSETAASAKALDLAYWSGARLHLAHCTHPHTFRLIDLYRQLGANVSGETCAHYLMLTDEDVAELGAVAKFNPPIRDVESLEALWELLREGKIATVSTDHAPWPIATKEGGVLRASAGAPGLESLLPVVYTAGIDRDFPVADLLGYVTWRPAEIFGVGDRKGRLEVGFDADLAVFDAREPRTFHAADSLSSAKWSPFDGYDLRGRVEATYLRGEPVFADGQVLAEPGSGQWLRRGPQR